MQWLQNDFLTYLTEWEEEVAAIPGLKKNEMQKLCLSKETMVGLKITGKQNDRKELDLISMSALIKIVRSEYFVCQFSYWTACL